MLKSTKEEKKYYQVFYTHSRGFGRARWAKYEGCLLDLNAIEKWLEKSSNISSVMITNYIEISEEEYEL